jgi:hypothetical protein
MTDKPKKPEEKPPEAAPADKKTGGMPSAGPHADPRLMNPDATPGSGAIAPIGVTDDANSQSTG